MKRLVLIIITINFVIIGNLFALFICQQDITEDTTWYLSDSPVYVYGNLTITNNAVLTIREGVEVLFMEIENDGGFEEGSELYVEDGSLIARGTDSRPVLFSSAEDIPYEGDWGCIAVEGDNIIHLEYCVIEYARTGLYLWNLSTFAESASIINYNEFSNNEEHAVLCYNSSPQLNYNIIKENEIGIKTLGYSSPAINHNDLCDNSIYNFSNNTNWNQTCENNWWGTTSRSIIEQSIYDEDDNSSSGYVDYEPYLGCSIEDGGEGNFSFTSLGMIRFHF